MFSLSDLHPSFHVSVFPEESRAKLLVKARYGMRLRVYVEVRVWEGHGVSKALQAKEVLCTGVDDIHQAPTGVGRVGRPCGLVAKVP